MKRNKGVLVTAVFFSFTLLHVKNCKILLQSCFNISYLSMWVSDLKSNLHLHWQMKLYVVFALLVMMLSTFIVRKECKAIARATDERASSKVTERQRAALPILMRLGEEYLIRLDQPKQDLRTSEHSSTPRTPIPNRALQLQLTQRLVQEEVDALQLQDSAERKRRGDEPPISLDLTFHLLREVLEIARAEQLAQQASNNRKMMEFFGK